MRFFKALALAALFPGAASAWTLNFDPPRRVSDALGFKVNYSNCPADLDPLLDEAFARWNEIPGSHLRIERNGTTAVTGADVAAGRYSNFVIACDTNYQTDASTDPNVTLATAFVDAEGPDIKRGAVLINVQTNLFNRTAHNQKAIVLIHEIGHVLGLGHSSDPKAIMYFQVRSAVSNTALAQDDIDAMVYLYGRKEFVPGSAKGGLFGCGVLAGRSVIDENSDPFGSGPAGVASSGFAQFLITLLFLRVIFLRRSPLFL